MLRLAFGAKAGHRRELQLAADAALRHVHNCPSHQHDRINCCLAKSAATRRNGKHKPDPRSTCVRVRVEQDAGCSHKDNASSMYGTIRTQLPEVLLQRSVKSAFDSVCSVFWCLSSSSKLQLVSLQTPRSIRLRLLDTFISRGPCDANRWTLRQVRPESFISCCRSNMQADAVAKQRMSAHSSHLDAAA